MLHENFHAIDTERILKILMPPIIQASDKLTLMPTESGNFSIHTSFVDGAFCQWCIKYIGTHLY